MGHGGASFYQLPRGVIVSDLLNNRWVRLGVVAAGVWAAYKYGKSPAIKTAAISIGAIVVARQVPIVRDMV